MIRSLRGGLAFVLVCGLGLAACGGPKEDPILRLSSEEALEQGKTLFEAEKFNQAQRYLQHAFEVEPNSLAGREALLLVADSLFRAGGLDNLIKAEARYRDFQNRFPTSDRAAYVQFQIANTLGKRIEKPDRDLDSTEKALAAYEDLIRLYPTSEYVDPARTEIGVVRTNLAEHEFVVGKFYLRYGLIPAAIARFEGVLERFPDYAERDKALLNLGLAYRQLKTADKSAEKAAEIFERLRTEHPDSKYLKEIPKK